MQTRVLSILKRPLGIGNGNPLQHSCLENFMNRGILVGYNPWGRNRVRHDLVTKQQQPVSTHKKKKSKVTRNAAWRS